MTSEDDRRLEQVEELLRMVGPPPELPPSLAAPPAVAPPAKRVPRRRPLRLALALAGATVFVAFAAGYLVGNRGDRVDTVAEVSMHGRGTASEAQATLEIGARDEAGNVPLVMKVGGLPRLPRGGWYELYLSKGLKPGASCGTFTTAGGETTVRFSVGYDLASWREAGTYDGWVVTAHVPGRPAAAKHVLLTT